MFTAPLNRRISAATLLLSGQMMACGGGADGPHHGPSGDPPIDLPSKDSLAPPRFLYVPGPEGRAVGIRAVIEHADGTLEATPVEVVLDGPERQTSGSATPPRAGSPHQGNRVPFAKTHDTRGTFEEARTRGTSRASLGCPAGGAPVTAIRTARNALSYLTRTISVGTYGVDQSLSSTFYFGQDGIFGSVAEGKSVYLPPNLVQAGTSTGVGVIAGDGSGALSVQFLEGLSSVSLSFGVGPWSVGYSFLSPDGGGFARAIQYDTSLSLSVASLSLLGSVGLAMQTSSTTLSPIHLLTPWKGGCRSETDERTPMQYFRDELEALEDHDESTLEDALAAEFAHDVLPILASLSSPSVGAPGHNVPAASNADMVSQFLSQDSAADSAVNTSIDGQIEDFSNAINKADDTSDGMVRAASTNRLHVERSVPSILGPTALLRESQAGLDAATELMFWLAATRSNKPRFVSPRVERIEIAAEEEAQIVVTADEIAALIDASPDDVLGATVLITIGVTGEPQSFVLEKEQLTLSYAPAPATSSTLIRIEVDLSTAQGAFPPDATEWVVRPSMRLVRVKAGPPSQVILHAPYRTFSGAPVSLNVQTYDHEGRLVRDLYRVRFVDQDGVELGEAVPEHGTALFQYVPKPSTPVLRKATEELFEVDDKARLGIEIIGKGFSRDARVFINGVEVDSNSRSVVDPETIYALLPEEASNGSLAVVVENPGGQRSSSVEVETSE
jgi:hypothetical protein